MTRKTSPEGATNLASGFGLAAACGAAAERDAFAAFSRVTIRKTATAARTAPSPADGRTLRTTSLAMFCSVLRPISGKNRPAATSATTAICGSRLESERAPGGGWFAISDLLHFRPAQNALGQEDQGDRQDGEGGDILVGEREITREEGLDETDKEAAQHRTRQRSDAAEDGGGEGLDAGDEAILIGDHSVIHEIHGARDRCECGAHHEGRRNRTVDIDAEEGRHAAVLLAGALGPAERGLLHHAPESGKKD